MKKEIKIAYFPSDALKNTVLTSNGTVLDNYCTKCETEENIENGNYTLDATFTLDALDYMDCENILKVKMDYGDEIFKISKVTTGTRYVDIVARQITIPATLCLYLDNVRPTNTMAAKSLETTDITEVIKAGNLNNLGELEHMGEEWIKWAFESLQVRLK